MPTGVYVNVLNIIHVFELTRQGDGSTPVIIVKKKNCVHQTGFLNRCFNHNPSHEHEIACFNATAKRKRMYVYNEHSTDAVPSQSHQCFLTYIKFAFLLSWFCRNAWKPIYKFGIYIYCTTGERMQMLACVTSTEMGVPEQETNMAVHNFAPMRTGTSMMMIHVSCPMGKWVAIQCCMQCRS
jgi:hypothetical protein